MGVMDTTTRRQILGALTTSPGATAAELAALLHLTKADILYHLKDLQDAGEITVTRQPGGCGRPVQHYHRSLSQSPSNIPALALALLTTLSTSDLISLAPQMFPLKQAEMGQPMTLRLGNAVQRLNTCSYRARWEAHQFGPRILFHACPYAAILTDAPSLCQLDAAILQHLLGARVVQQSRLDPQTGRPPVCAFLIAPPETVRPDAV